MIMRRNTLDDRCRRLSQTMRLAILVSVFWPIFSFVYIIEPNKFFAMSEFVRKFMWMGIVPLVCGWGLWLVGHSIREKKRLKRNPYL